MVKWVGSLQPMQNHSGADIHTTMCEHYAAAGGCAPKEATAHAGPGSWQELQPIEQLGGCLAAKVNSPHAFIHRL